MEDFGDLSYLLEAAYSAELARQLSAAQLWTLSYSHRQAPTPGRIYLLPYTIEQYKRVAMRLKLWDFPRGHHKHVASIPFL